MVALLIWMLESAESSLWVTSHQYSVAVWPDILCTCLPLVLFTSFFLQLFIICPYFFSEVFLILFQYIWYKAYTIILETSWDFKCIGKYIVGNWHIRYYFCPNLYNLVLRESQKHVKLTAVWFSKCSEGSGGGTRASNVVVHSEGGTPHLPRSNYSAPVVYQQFFQTPKIKTP